MERFSRAIVPPLKIFVTSFRTIFFSKSQILYIHRKGAKFAGKETCLSISFRRKAADGNKPPLALTRLLCELCLCGANHPFSSFDET
jgi:hypothetical protein